jgi:hypothetical protein
MDYLNAWRFDQARWLDHINVCRSQYRNSAVRALQASTPEKVLSELGLMEQGRYVGRSVVTVAHQSPDQHVTLL